MRVKRVRVVKITRDSFGMRMPPLAGPVSERHVEDRGKL